MGQLGQQLDSHAELAIGLDGALVARGQRNVVFPGRRADEGVVDRAARDPAASAPRNLPCGKVTANRRATAPGVRRAGGGRRVRTEKVSNAA